MNMEEKIKQNVGTIDSLVITTTLREDGSIQANSTFNEAHLPATAIITVAMKDIMRRIPGLEKKDLFNAIDKLWTIFESEEVNNKQKTEDKIETVEAEEIEETGENKNKIDEDNIEDAQIIKK